MKWVTVLNGSVLDGGVGTLPASGLTADDVDGFLSTPPDGLGVPALRVEDQTFPQRDGVGMYADWYENRIVTLEEVSIAAPPGCQTDPARTAEMASNLMQAWSRECGMAELVIFTDRHDPDADDTRREITGPFGVRGRPRVAQLTWLGQGTRVGQALLRFDSTDHRLYVLDAQGTPGSGGQCSGAIPVQTESNAYSDMIKATPGLVRYWRLNDTGTVADDQMNNADGTITPGTRSQPPLQLGTSRSFSYMHPNSSTTTAGVSLPLLTFTLTGTVEFWYQTAATSMMLLQMEFNYWIELTPTTMEVNWGNAGVTFPRPAADRPHHVVITKSGGLPRVYIDGFFVGSPTSNGTVVDSPLLFGTNGFLSPTYGVPVFVSDVAQYTGVLTAQQISQHYQAGFNWVGGQDIEVGGTLCVPFRAEFAGTTTAPRVILEDGSFVGLTGRPAGAVGSMFLDTETGSATYTNGYGVEVSDPSLIVGDPFLTLNPGTNHVGLRGEGAADSGTVNLCWRPAVISA